MSKHYKYEIKFDNINDVPELWIDGKKIKIMQNVQFSWNTATGTKKCDASFSAKFLKHVKPGDRIEINQFSTSTLEASHRFEAVSGDKFGNNQAL